VQGEGEERGARRGGGVGEEGWRGRVAVAWLQEQQGRHCELDAGDEGGRRVQHEPAQGGEGREEGLEAGEELLSTEAWLVKEWLIPRGSRQERSSYSVAWLGVRGWSGGEERLAARGAVPT